MLTNIEIEHEKEALLQQLLQYLPQGDLILKNTFLSCIWESVTRLVDHHRHHELVRTAVGNFPDFVPRSFTILAILYGAYSSQNNVAALCRDIVGLLEKDLKEEEEKVLMYSRTIQHPPFFPGLHGLWVSVNSLYGEHDGFTLPPTPHSAFSLLALNHPEVIGKPVEAEELHEKLLELHEKLSICLAMAESSHIPGTAVKH